VKSRMVLSRERGEPVHARRTGRIGTGPGSSAESLGLVTAYATVERGLDAGIVPRRVRAVVAE